MRLTLRTLLSYLDDTLEPAQAKAIGAKVAESEQARELMERIRQVTRRRRLTTPPTSGPGGIDPSTIAEYLDSEVTPEKAAEVEQICLASDVHLAEVAACHQILTLVLGEPALVPPSAKQRMVGLVKGPESIPFRKVSKTTTKADLDLSSEIDADQDDTLRMGVPSVSERGRSRNVWLFVGGGVLAACLFGVAVWQLIHSIPGNVDPINNEPIAQGDKDPKKIDTPKVDDKTKPTVEKDKVKDKEEKIPLPKKDKEATPTPEVKGIVVVPVKIVPPPEIPFRDASMKQVPMGQYVAAPLKAPAVLLQAKPGKNGWTRVAGKNAPVLSGRMLLSLPGSKNVVALDSGIELTLWGNLFEVTLDPLLAESRATVHSHDILDLDLTLDRGRIVLRNQKKGDRDALTRVRFANPTLGEEEHFDIALTPGAAVVVERSCEMDREEPFHDDPKTPRQGPIATMRIYALTGASTIHSAKLTYSIDETQQPVVQWQSRQGVLTTPAKIVLPPWLKGTPPLKDKGEQVAREKAIFAHDYLAKIMDKDNKPIDVALTEVLQTVQAAAQREIDKQKTISLETYVLWRHAVRCQAAIDDIAHLFEAFDQDNTPIFVRGLCMTTIQQWIPLARDNDYVLLDEVRNRINKKQASIKVVELFHMISTEDARKPITYQSLIENLNNDLLPIRTLSHWHLINLAPAGAQIPYDPAMPRELREMAAREWMRLIPPGQLPPAPKAPMKKDKS